MKEKANRRARVLRVRVIEHRAVSARLAIADASIANLARIATRLTALRCSLAAVQGEAAGASLNAMAEMSQRLEAATVSLVRPISDAEQVRAQVFSERIATHRSQESAAKLYESALSLYIQKSEQRADASRYFRPRISRLGEDV